MRGGIPSRRTRTVTQSQAFSMALQQGVLNIPERPFWALVRLLSASIGVALAILIMAVGNGLSDEINRLLPAGQVPPQIKLKDIHDVLEDGQSALKWLAYFCTAAVVGLVTGLSLS